MNTTQYEIVNVGTPGFPKFEVRLNVIDEQGFDLEHLSEVIGYAPSHDAALTLKWKHEHGKPNQPAPQPSDTEMLNWLLGRMYKARPADPAHGTTQDIWGMLSFHATGWDCQAKGFCDMRAIVAEAMSA